MSNGIFPTEIIMLDVPPGMQIKVVSPVGPFYAYGPCSVPYSIPPNSTPPIAAIV